MTTDFTHRLVVAAVTHGETRLWALKDPAGTEPEVLTGSRVDEHHNHFKQSQRNEHHEPDKFDRPYFEGIAQTLKPAQEIILIGHGVGKANAMAALVQYLEKYHPETAKKVVTKIDSHIESMTSGAILAMARDWYRTAQRTGLPTTQVTSHKY